MFGRGLLATLCAALFGAAMVTNTTPAQAGSPFLEVPPEEEVVDSPSYRYANMTNEEALAELERRDVPFAKEKPRPGVRLPVRLTGKLHGVWIHSSLPEEERKASMFEVLDARLALTLDDFSLILARYDIVEVVHYTMYRPNVAEPGAVAQKPATKDADKKSDAKGKRAAANKPAAKEGKQRPKGKRRAALEGKGSKDTKHGRRNSDSDKKKEIDLADDAKDDLGSFAELQKGTKKSAPKKAAPTAPKNSKSSAPNKARKSAKKKLPQSNGEHAHGKWAPPGTRHPAGLAIDIGTFIKSDGSSLHVASDFRGKIGSKTCGADVPEADSREARELRSIVCDARAAGVFTYALTPNFDAAHADHLHLEIKPATKWFLYH